jgi:Rrf2 family protein
MVLLAQRGADAPPTTVIGVSQRLNVSKIYLEQIFALLRRGGLVSSTKGAQGGYQPARPLSQISAADILAITENAIFEDIESVAPDAEPGIERALQDTLFRPANEAFKRIFQKTTLADLVEETRKRAADGAYIYCI